MNTDETSEFFKLDDTDKKVLFWIMDNDPQAIAAWTREIARQYEMRSIHIEPRKLLAEIQLELNS